MPNRLIHRTGVFLLRYLSLFLMPVLFAAFIAGCLYRLCADCLRAARAALG